MFEVTTPAVDCDERKAGEWKDEGRVPWNAGRWSPATFPSTEDLIAGNDNLTGHVCRRIWMKKTAFVTAWHKKLQLQILVSGLLLSFCPFVPGCRAHTRTRAHRYYARGHGHKDKRGGRGLKPFSLRPRGQKDKRTKAVAQGLTATFRPFCPWSCGINRLTILATRRPLLSRT